ncbi:hypothetical protein EJ110_NYTH41591 [Nymphaea thermarum]|nr:hypothetical protein EJ110_NYTH41591 [Nymphaea thermarum]
MASLYTRRLATRLSTSFPGHYRCSIFSSHSFFSYGSSVDHRPPEAATQASPNKFSPPHQILSNSFISERLPSFRNPADSFISGRLFSSGQTPIIFKCSYPGTRYFSSPSADSESQNPPKTESPTRETIDSFKSQEIEGPTVERDLSPLANETREVLDKLRRSIYNLSNAVALLGIAQLICGAWVSWITREGVIPETLVQGVAAFGFPFTMAFLLRQAAKPMGFFRKVEEMGRLQILTLALQTVKSVDLLIRRVQVISLICGASLLTGLLFVAWSH